MDSASYTRSSRFLQWEIYMGAKKEERPVGGRVCSRKWLDCAGQKELTVNEHLLCVGGWPKDFKDICSFDSLKAQKVEETCSSPHGW